MRKEYDLRQGERGKFFGRVDTENSIIEDDDTLDVAFDIELLALESNLHRIRQLKSRLAELNASERERIARRLSTASEVLEEIALSR